MIEAGQLYQDLRKKHSWRQVMVLARPFKGEKLLCTVFSLVTNQPIGRALRIPIEVLCDPTRYKLIERKILAKKPISEHPQESP
jgi:hypothetical protein